MFLPEKTLNHWVFTWVLLTLVLSSCIPQAPIRVGLISELSGKQSELGVQMRNGAQLAVEEMNAAGGINGRKIELFIEDDLGTPEGAVQAENKVIDQGAVAVIGHFTSNQTVEGFKIAEQRGVVLFSPTGATSELSGKKDLFFRVITSTDKLGSEFARYIFQRRGLSKIAIIYDADNHTYSGTLAEAFTRQFSSLGGQVTDSIAFSGQSSPDFAPLIDQLRSSAPQGVLIITAPNNAASISQQIFVSKWSVPLFAGSWAQGQSLIQNGGKAVEGLELLVPFDINSEEPAYQTFRTRYQQRFAIDPAFTAIFGYETAQILGSALKKTGGTSQGLPEALTEIKAFPGLTCLITLDEYGDVQRPLFVLRVDHLKFVTVEMWGVGQK